MDLNFSPEEEAFRAEVRAFPRRQAAGDACPRRCAAAGT